jgi:hypothetical protein
VWSSPKSASHITALFVFGPLPERLLTLSPLTRAQEQRRDTSPSSFDGRTPRTSPSRTRGLGLLPPPQPSLLRVRGTLPFNSPSSRNPVPYPIPTNTTGVRRQRSHAR